MKSTITSITLFLLFALSANAQEANQITIDVDPTKNDLIRNEGVFSMDIVDGIQVRENEVRAGLLYDAEKGVVVWEKGMHFAYPIASITKLMVALVSLDDIKAGKVDWSDEVKVDRVYRKSSLSRQTYRTTETYTLESLMQLAMIPSNNQACSDIAIYHNGTVAAFLAIMNEKAVTLGMKNTFFSNPSGLPGAVKELDNRSSPHDLLILALEVIKHEELLNITSIGYAEVSNNKRTGIFRNTNHLVINYENEVDGLKTGFTKRAKSCLIATSKKDNYRMISIALGIDGPYLRNEIVASMLNNYYDIIGCGAMTPTTGGPVAKKSMINDPAKANDIASNDPNAQYKTVWTKQKKTHTIRRGESLSTIAQKYRCTYQQIKKWNGLKSDRIYAGQRLMVYVKVAQKIAIKAPEPPDNEDETAPIENDGAIQITENTPGDSIGIIVQPADSILDNSFTLATTTETISKPAEKPAVKKSVPQTSVAKKPVPPKPTPNKNFVYHIVQPGDTLWDIAKKYDGISPEDIQRSNNIRNSKALKPGTKLKIVVRTS